MKKNLPLFLGCLFALFGPGMLSAAESDIHISENFFNLNEWEPLYFEKIKEYSRYSLEKDPEGGTVLVATSKASASGLLYKKEFDVYKYPILSRRWKVDNVYRKGDALKKSGDDYPIRIYIVFKYIPEKASLGERIKYKTAKIIYGKYPPHSSLNYIWANKSHPDQYLTSPYTRKAKMVVMESGNSKAGEWVEYTVNVLQDYKKAFGTDPPKAASLAIMNDSDNTGESSVSRVDYIAVKSQKP